MVKKGDFIQINYTGRIKDSRQVFDTTDEKVAHAEGMEHHHGSMKPVVICLGEGHILPALDVKLEGKSLGKHTAELSVEEGFGKKDVKLLKLIPMKLFAKENINPMPGLAVNVDNQTGTVRAVSGGRVIVDFNHPLAGQELVYEIEILKEVHDKKEQVEGIFNIRQFPFKSISIHENKAEIIINFPLPKEIEQQLADELKRTVKLDSVSFKEEKIEKKEKDEKPEKKEQAEKQEEEKPGKKE